MHTYTSIYALHTRVSGERVVQGGVAVFVLVVDVGPAQQQRRH